MRITNKIIQNNSLTNINTNKVLQDKLSNQISTSKKIARPSDDPIVALRSLRLRTSVNQTDQYLNKNVADAESWIRVTEDAIGTLSDIITDIRKQYVKGSSDSLTVADRRIIAENLQALSEEIYNTGNADFAGRTVFTGFRTDSPLTFPEATTQRYEIIQNFDMGDLDEVTFVETEAATADPNYGPEQRVYETKVSRIRLPYNNIDSDITFDVTKPGDSPTDPPTTVNTVSVKVTLADGTVKTINAIAKNKDEILSTDLVGDTAILAADTGELFFSDTVADEIRGGAKNVEVIYAKSNWNKNDLMPEHYFTCSSNGIEYNYDESVVQEICYNIGVNQTLRINTTADECFNHDIRRDINDVLECISEVETVEKKVSDLRKEFDEIAESDTAARSSKQQEIDAAKKEQTFLNGKLQDMFTGLITKADGYLDQNNIALTNCGTRSKRLELIENRLDTQITTLQELKSDNEDVDLAETAIKLSSAKYAYDASLMATGKIVKESLLDYI